MGYVCKWCDGKEHETVYDCPMTELILPADIPFPPDEFGRRMKLLLEPTDDDLKG